METFLPEVVNSLLIEQTIFRKVSLYIKANRISQNVFCLIKITAKSQGVFITLNYNVREKIPSGMV